LRIERGCAGSAWRSFVSDGNVSVDWRLNCRQIYLRRRVLSEREDSKEGKEQKGGHGRPIMVVEEGGEKREGALRQRLWETEACRYIRTSRDFSGNGRGRGRAKYLAVIDSNATTPSISINGKILMRRSVELCPLVSIAMQQDCNGPST